jgi:site-specific DNA recombinase
LQRDRRNARPRYDALLAAVADGRLRAVAAWGQDRLCRKPGQFEEFRNIAKANSVLFATRSGIKNLARAADTFNARNEVNAAAYEVENMVERMIEKFEELAGEGRAWWPRRPFGYTMPRRGEKRGQWYPPELVKREADAIRQAYADVRAGRSLKAIAREWNSAGLRTPATPGCECEPAPDEFPCNTCNRKRRAMPDGTQWSGMAIRQLLLAPRNAAQRTYHGEIVGEADWPAIVSEQVWRGAVSKLTDPARLTPGGGFSAPRKYLLSGIATCSECKHTLSSMSPSNSPNLVYACKNPGCLKVRRRMSDVDAWVTAHIVTALTRDIDVLTARRDVDTTDLLARLQEIEGDKNQAAAMVASKQITLSQLAIINADYDREVTEIQARMRDSEKIAVLEDFIGVSDVAAKFDSIGLDRRRAVINLLCTVTVHPGQAARRPFNEELVKVAPKH